MLYFKKLNKVILLFFFFFNYFFFELYAQNEVDEVEEIIVTGSRIKTTATDSFSPVSIVDQEDIFYQVRFPLVKFYLSFLAKVQD